MDRRQVQNLQIQIMPVGVSGVMGSKKLKGAVFFILISVWTVDKIYCPNPSALPLLFFTTTPCSRAAKIFVPLFARE